jgi:hypothetical protein
MDTYPCPKCDGVANATDGCSSCGRPHDPFAAAMAKINAALARLENASHRPGIDRDELRARRTILSGKRDVLNRAIAIKLAKEGSARQTTRTTAQKSAPPKPRTFGGAGPTVPVQPPSPPTPPDEVGVETSPRGAQNTLLTLGGLLLGIASIVFTGLYYSQDSGGGRGFVLVIATTLCLGVPVLLARRTLTATAETIAAIGLLLVLLDGYNAYSANLAGLQRVPPPLFAAALFMLVAGVASAYRLATHLRAPQFAALLAVQPWAPLVAVHLDLGRVGFAVIFGLVAAGNLGAVSLFSSEPTILAVADRLRTRSDPSRTTGAGWPRMLRELAWLLYGLSLAAAAALAIASLISAQTIGAAVVACLALLLGAGVAVAGGQLSGRETARHVALGAAALAIIAAIVRVNLLALPQFTLVLTAAVAAAVAIAANLLPEQLRRGPQLGALLGAILTALVVLGQTLGIALATVGASTTPQVWAADLSAFADRAHTADWQVAAAALLLAILATAAAPGDWRVDAAVLGGAIAVVAAPGAGAMTWWAVPVLATLAATVATATALYAAAGRNVLIRSGSAAVLGLFAIATSLSRPELTAGVCTTLALSAAALAITTAGWPNRFGRYADRVADSAAGAAALTLPIAVGTYAWLGGAPSRVLVPLTLLATALGVLGAALSQVAARAPRMASAGGALLAAVGSLVFTLTHDGAVLGDIGLAVLLLAASVATANSRAFGVFTGGLLEGARWLPASEGALTGAVDGEAERSGAGTPRMDGRTLGAALATASVIVALARLLAVAVPGIGLVTTTAMVLVTALAVRTLPEEWRLGPRLGASAVGGAIVAVCAAVAIGEATRAISAGLPFWAADLDAWRATVSSWAPFEWQVPASLLLAALTAWVLLPTPIGADIGYVTLCMAGLALPASLALPWWSPTLIAATLAVVAGAGAALVGHDDPIDVAHRRLGLAAMLGLYAVAAASASAGLTGTMLSVVVAAGVLVASIAQLRGPHVVPGVVPGIAAAAALVAAPGAAATLAVSGGSSRAGVLGAALSIATAGALAVWALRGAGVRWGPWPAGGAGLASLAIAGAALPGVPLAESQTWAAASALVAAVAAAAVPVTRSALTAPDRMESEQASPARRPPRTGRPGALGIIVATAGPAAVIAAIASAPAWLAALVGPYRTLRHAWQGDAVAPVVEHAGTAVLTLLLLTATAAAVAITLGGGHYLLAAILPPLAALLLLAPAALGAPRGAATWTALGVAVATGLGAALSPPTLPSARQLRGMAAVVCAVTGATGIAGSLATRTATLTALGVLVAAAAIAAALGRDPAVRMVAWIVAAVSSVALPVTAVAAAGAPVRPAAFGVLAMCAWQAALAWLLARHENRRAEAAMVELCGWIGAAFALLLTLGSTRHTAAVLTIWGLLLGAAALRRDRPPERRQWLVRAALAAELGACWLLLFAVEVGLPEAYTLPFAAVALLAGALELSRRPELSSWVAYGPALAGGFLPTVALVLVSDAEVWRWVTLFVVAIVVVLLGSWRRRRAPVVGGATVAVVVALVEMIRLLVQGAVAGAILVAVAGVILIVFGALSEKRLRGALRSMS